MLMLFSMLSLVAHIFLKAAANKEDSPYKKGVRHVYARFFLGLFIAFAGLHAYGTLGSQLALFICIVFLLLAGANIYAGVRQLKFIKSVNAQQKG
ncbi:YtpI family protein [Aureibacillus halotolerans]|uniref:YtpI-like protein n=1 Tax=Aureibacillus halotolerans TaxID=1508390 RepID=A0A4R6U3Q2_9BACI|nr:YtpI family protein [Aureibacillus halotolerans]TDQ39129.1 YtpI-like protein [Aureibacillus halotolerans]